MMKIKRYKEFNEDAVATASSTAGMGAVSSAQPGALAGTTGTTGSGDLGFVFKKEKRKKGKPSEVSDLRDLAPAKINKVNESRESNLIEDCVVNLTDMGFKLRRSSKDPDLFKTIGSRGMVYYNVELSKTTNRLRWRSKGDKDDTKISCTFDKNGIKDTDIKGGELLSDEVELLNLVDDVSHQLINHLGCKYNGRFHIHIIRGARDIYTNIKIDWFYKDGKLNESNDYSLIDDCIIDLIDDGFVPACRVSSYFNNDGNFTIKLAKIIKGSPDIFKHIRDKSVTCYFNKKEILNCGVYRDTLSKDDIELKEMVYDISNKLINHLGFESGLFDISFIKTSVNILHISVGIKLFDRDKKINEAVVSKNIDKNELDLIDECIFDLTDEGFKINAIGKIEGDSLIISLSKNIENIGQHRRIPNYILNYNIDNDGITSGVIQDYKIKTKRKSNPRAFFEELKELCSSSSVKLLNSFGCENGEVQVRIYPIDETILVNVKIILNIKDVKETKRIVESSEFENFSTSEREKIHDCIIDLIDDGFEHIGFSSYISKLDGKYVKNIKLVKQVELDYEGSLSICCGFDKEKITKSIVTKAGLNQTLDDLFTDDLKILNDVDDVSHKLINQLDYKSGMFQINCTRVPGFDYGAFFHKINIEIGLK